MPTEITQGHVEAARKLTAEVFYKPTADAGYRRLGNVVAYKENHESSPVTRMVSENGSRRRAQKQVDTHGWEWEFTLDEMDGFTQELLRLGTQGSNANQAAATAPSGTATISSVQTGRWHAIGKQGLDTLVATISATTLVEGTDYEVDLDAGLIYFYDTDDVDDGDSCSLTFGCDAIDYVTHTVGDNPLFRGDILIIERNQFSKTPLQTTTFVGTLMPTEWPDQSGEFGQYKVVASAETKPATKTRSAA